MTQLSFIKDEKTYRGFTTEQYKQTILDYSDAMFKLFDSNRKYANGNLGMHIMWLGSWTSKFVGRDTVDYAIENNVPLNIALIEVLKLNCGGSGKNELGLMIDILNGNFKDNHFESCSQFGEKCDWCSGVITSNLDCPACKLLKNNGKRD